MKPRHNLELLHIQARTFATGFPVGACELKRSNDDLTIMNYEPVAPSGDEEALLAVVAGMPVIMKHGISSMHYNSVQ